MVLGPVLLWVFGCNSTLVCSMSIKYKFGVESRFPVGSCSLNNRLGLPRWRQWSKTKTKALSVTAGDMGDVGSTPGLGRSPGGGNGSLLQGLLPGKSHGRRSLGGYSPWGRKRLTWQACMQQLGHSLAYYCSSLYNEWMYG